MSEEISAAQSYVDFVQKTITKYEAIGDLIMDDQVLPSRVNYALAAYYSTSLMLNSEYQRAKIDFVTTEREYKAWWDEHFELAKEDVIAEYASTKIKPSVTEFEVRTRTRNKEDFKEWQIKLSTAEAKMRFILRMMETMDRYDKILTNLSNNMRSEMMVLSIDKRANMSPATNSQNRIRGQFPEERDYVRRRAERQLATSGSEVEDE